MNWFQQNRWLGTFLIVLGVCTLGASYFVYSAKSGSDEALARFNEAAAERTRLERLDPFPTESNFKKMKVHLENYNGALNKLKEDLKTRVLPAPPLAPNEFQSRLRQAMVAMAEKARVNKVKLPDNFALGFDEFTAALPNTAAAPLLGQELAQIEMLLNMLIDARVDSVGALIRVPLPEERGAVTPAPATAAGRKAPVPVATGPKMLERASIDVTFTSSPSAARKVLNQLGSSNQQFYITRTVHIRNEKDKGPARQQAGVAGTSVAATPAVPVAPTAPVSPANPATPALGKTAAAPALSFIVGNEHVETSARVELIRFTF
jgi:hypothetical protein